MKSNEVDYFFEKQEKYKEPLLKIRALLLGLDLEENWKWKMPVYTFNDKNIVSLNAFKNHFGVWFFNGVFLKDPDNLLVNAQEGKTQSMRHLKYFTNNDIDDLILENFVIEAMQNEKEGKKLTREKKVLRSTDFMRQYLDLDSNLDEFIEILSRSCKKEYIEYINEAK